MISPHLARIRSASRPQPARIPPPCRMAPTEEHFGPLVEHLLHLFRRERVLLEKRGALIVRQLCEHLAPRKVWLPWLAALLHCLTLPPPLPGIRHARGRVALGRGPRIRLAGAISLDLLCSRHDLHTTSQGLAAQMVQQLNLILLTTPEAIELRSRLKQSTASAARWPRAS